MILVSLQDINMQKAFRLTIRSDQQVLSRETLPEAMKESYGKCEPVPNLNALTPFRHDGREALTLYTDPTYFFELWKQKMNVEVEKRRKKKVFYLRSLILVCLDVFLKKDRRK